MYYLIRKIFKKKSKEKTNLTMRSERFPIVLNML